MFYVRDSKGARRFGHMGGKHLVRRSYIGEVG